MLEGRILSLLSEHLMEPELLAAFAEEYLAERNRLGARQDGDRAQRQAELSRVIKEQERLVDAILKGTPAERITARMAQLAARQKDLERGLAAIPAPARVRFHPGLAETYRPGSGRSWTASRIPIRRARRARQSVG